MNNYLTFSGEKLSLTIGELKDFVCDIKLTEIKNGYVLKRTVKNDTDKTLRLSGIKAILSEITFGKDPTGDYYYCNENARLFCTMTVPVDYNRYNDGAKENERFNLPVNRKWCDPEVKDGKICSSPYMPFPAILISNYKSTKGIVIGSLSQDVFYHSYEVGHKNGKVFVEIYSAFKDIAYREVKPNEELTDIIYIGETEHADDINYMFENYVMELRKVLKENVGASETNRHTLIWDSWNDGIYRNVSEEILLQEAKATKEYFSNLEWFQLDDGYSAYCEEDVDLDAHGLGVPYEGKDGIDNKKFPNGLKGYTDKIKAMGLKPSVWIGGFCPVKTKIYKERPEWFIDYKYRIDWTQPLDISKKDAREYMTFAIETFVKEYGFEGIKHDFWSYAFEDRHDLLASKEKSGYEWRTFWQSFMRRTVKDGYIETACDLSMGNPFNGKYFNNYRFSLDVGAGKWENVKTCLFWSAAVLSAKTGDLFVPNSDSIGLLPGLNDTDFMFVVNWQIITRTLVEISGRYSRVDKENPRLKVLQRATQYLNNGENVYFAKYDYRKVGENLPEIIYINSAFDSGDKNYKTVALFNAAEHEKEISFSVKDIGLSDGNYVFSDVWNNLNTFGSKITVKLNAHESRLYKVKSE